MRQDGTTRAVRRVSTDADGLMVSLGAGDVPHPGGTLLDHLRRVQALLAGWGASPDVQLAGLCHATYGTDGFDVVLLDPVDGRAALRDVVGATVEGLVHLYGSCDRGATYPDLGAVEPEFVDRRTGARRRPGPVATRAFVEITAANELDVVRHNADLAARHGAALARLMHRTARHLSDPARAAWDDWAGQNAR